MELLSISRISGVDRETGETCSSLFSNEQWGMSLAAQKRFKREAARKGRATPKQRRDPNHSSAARRSAASTSRSQPAPVDTPAVLVVDLPAGGEVAGSGDSSSGTLGGDSGDSDPDDPEPPGVTRPRGRVLRRARRRA
jgi:hypothetical protein